MTAVKTDPHRLHFQLVRFKPSSGSPAVKRTPPICAVVDSVKVLVKQSNKESSPNLAHMPCTHDGGGRGWVGVEKWLRSYTYYSHEHTRCTYSS